MSICAIICEFNPMHNGHEYAIKRARELSGCDKVIAVMSGNFTQRGDIAVLHKLTRAKHAISAGADAVIELPTVFATANAEIFAKGAVKIISNIPDVTHLAFGAEDDDKQAFLNIAHVILSESSEYKKLLKNQLKKGSSFIRARQEALIATNDKISTEILEKPNNILALEYTKAILSGGCEIEIVPIKRIGAQFSDDTLYSELSSASAIREALAEKNEKQLKKNLKVLKNNVPPFVFPDLKDDVSDKFRDLCFFSALANPATHIAKALDCTEGLENRIKAFLKDNLSYSELISKCVSKRYTKARIKRILLANLLSVSAELIYDSLEADLYIHPLAVRNRAEMLPILGKATYPVVTRKHDLFRLSDAAKKCIQADIHANDIYNFISQMKSADVDCLYID